MDKIDISQFLKAVGVAENQSKHAAFIGCLRPEFQLAAAYFLTPNLNPALRTPSMEEVEATLTSCQNKAWSKIKEWLVEDKEKCFVLKGPAGTGKSYLMKMLKDYGHNFTDYGISFTAPTNKAAGVLSTAIKDKAKTIYSLLGITMSQEEDEIKLKFPDVDKNVNYQVIVIDESSMLNETMIEYLDSLLARYPKLRILYVGDPYQLPPVGERSSKSWKKASKKYTVMMTTVKRFDSTLLVLATAVREQIKNKEYDPDIVHDIKDGFQVRVVANSKFEKLARACAEDPEQRIIAWRNKTVNLYNNNIRKYLGYKNEFEVGERLLLSSPMFVDGGLIVGSPDDECEVLTSDSMAYSKCESPIPCFLLGVKFQYGTFQVLTPTKDGKSELERNLRLLAAQARAEGLEGRERSRLWAQFWLLKQTFAFFRYSFAMTAHRSQGSTYTSVYVDAGDILANRNTREAYRCLYVAYTRATSHVFITL